MRVHPYLSFNGQCEEAFAYYEVVLGAKLDYRMTWGESPMADQVPDEMHNQIMHGALTLGNDHLMGAGAPPGEYERPAGTSLSVHISDASEAERTFRALAEAGSVRMPFQRTFWSAGFGMCVDRFGVPWIVNCEQE